MALSVAFLLGRRSMRASALAFSLLVSSLSLAIEYHTIDFSAQQNYRLQNMDGSAGQLPTGDLYAGDVPFHIKTGAGNNAYLSAQPPGGGERSVDIGIELGRAMEVHTLVNTWWGTRSTTAYAYLEFYGSGGAYHRYNLVGNRDVRDYLFSDYTNTINGTTTTNAVTVSDGKYWQVRLDAQHILLPQAFEGQTLQKMRLVDNGDTGFQRTFLAGVTVGVNPVPEPATMLALGGASALLLRRRRSR